MELGNRELILAGSVQQLNIWKFMVEEMVDSLDIIGDFAEERWFR